MHVSPRQTRRFFVPVLIGTGVVIADQVSKWLIIERLGPGADRHRASVIGDLVELRYAQNTGVAFGLLQGQGVLVPLLSIAVVAFLLRMYLRVGAPSPWFAVGSGLVLGGALGNVIDRMRLGYVVDFISIAWWPTFNLADVAITCGAAVLLVWYWRAASRSELASTDGIRYHQGPAALRSDADGQGV
ncbi:MAG TPA: signal peptidase II [Thermomicrobiales bacterium]